MHHIEFPNKTWSYCFYLSILLLGSILQKWVHDYVVSTVLWCGSQGPLSGSVLLAGAQASLLFPRGGKLLGSISHGVQKPLILCPKSGSCSISSQLRIPCQMTQVRSQVWNGLSPVCFLLAFRFESSQLETICRRKICEKSASGVRSSDRNLSYILIS